MCLFDIMINYPSNLFITKTGLFRNLRDLDY